MRDFFKKLVREKASQSDDRPAVTDLNDDPRWRRIHNRKWTCTCCGDEFYGLPDWGAQAPDYWDGDPDPNPNETVLTSDHFLSEDFCVVKNEVFFVRCLLELPIIGSESERFGFGVWSSLSRQNFEIYRDGFDNCDYSDWGPWFGWFSNGLRGYPETLKLKCHVHPQPDNMRPLIELEDTVHPLSAEQHNGITFDRALELHALNGHDLRVALTD